MLVVVVVAGVIAGCGQASRTTTVPPGQAAQSGVAARLAGMAYAQAHAAGNPHPQSAAYVASHRQVSVRVSEGGDRVDSNQPVWVVEVVGPFPHFQRFSVPPGVNPSMRCQAITFTVERSTWHTLDSGCGRAFDLAKLGHPTALAPPPTPPSPPPATAASPGCLSSSAPSVRVGPGKTTVHLTTGRVVTVWLTEPEAYASSPDDIPPPTAFPWLAAESSDPTNLSPLAVCKHPPLVTSLPVRLYPFRAIQPGRYQITARLNPAYHTPQFRPPLRPLHPARVTVVVTSPPVYTVMAPVLYRTYPRR